MNQHSQPPPQQAAISIHDLISMRVALAQIASPSPDLSTAMSDLDRVIRTFTSSLNTAGPTS